MNFSDHIKNSTKNIIISKICSLLEKNPSKNMDKLFNLSMKIIKDNNHKLKIQKVYDYYNDNPLVKNLIENFLLNLNPNFLKKFTTNFLSSVLNNSTNTKFPFFIINLSSENNLSNITYNEMDLILNKIKEKNILYVFIIGKEPFTVDFLFKLYKKYCNIIFILFTNGEIFTPKICNTLSTLNNVITLISLDGFKTETDHIRGTGTFNKIICNMNLLKSKSIPFGIFSNISLNNFNIVTSDKFINMILDKGAFINLYFYNSVINQKKQQLKLYRKIKRLKIAPSHLPINFLDSSISNKIIIDKNSLYSNNLKLNFNNIKYYFSPSSLNH